MRVVFLSKYAVSPQFGAPTRQFFYCKYLAQNPDFDVMMISSRSATCDPSFSFRGLASEHTYDRLTHVVLNGKPVTLGFSLRRVWTWLWFEWQILRYLGQLRRWRPDVIVVSSLSILTFVTGVFLKWFFNKPLVIEIRDIYPRTLIELGRFSWLNPFIVLLGWIERFGYHYADAIVSSLPNLNPHVAKILGCEKAVVYLPMGYDPAEELISTDNASPPKHLQAILRQMDEVEGNIWFAYVGSIGLANALDAPLSAFRELATSHPHIHLVLVGDGPLRKHYAREFKNVANIHFVGQLPQKQLHHVLSRISVAINPWLDRPIYEFGISPNKWIDYFRAGKPILASYGGYRLILEEENCGWFIPPEDKDCFRDSVIRISQIPADTLKDMGSRGQQLLFKNLGYDNLALRLREVLESVVAKTKRNSI